MLLLRVNWKFYVMCVRTLALGRDYLHSLITNQVTTLFSNAVWFRGRKLDLCFRMDAIERFMCWCKTMMLAA